MDKSLRRYLSPLLLLACMTPSVRGVAQVFPITVSTVVMPPLPPYLAQLSRDVSRHLSISLRYFSPNGGNVRIKLAGKIERLSPSPISVSLRPDYVPSQPIQMGPQQPILTLTPDLLEAAFGNFEVNDLEFANTDLDQLRDGVNYKLPEGVYRICVTAYDYDKPGFSAPLSPPGTGCAVFTICYTASAPQLIQPVSTMVQPTGEFQPFTPHSPQVNFTWTPPATTCGTPLGAVTYDLEIRQVFDGQTVTDAVNNPYVFRQVNIPTNNYILDTLRYPHVLIPGNNYITRVHANLFVPPGSPLSIANQGYSQIGAFAYQTGGPFDMIALRPQAGIAAGGGKITVPPGGFRVESAPGACPDVPSVDKTPIATGTALGGQDLAIGAFTLHTDNTTTANTDGTYTGTGYVTWTPAGHPIQLKATFSHISVNTAKAIYAGSVVTTTDPTHSEWAPLATASQAAAVAGLPASGALENYVNQATHLLGELNGSTPVDLPIGLNNSTLPGIPTTLAIMGVTFTPTGTSMNVLFDLNVPEANDWLSLAGTGFCINPTGISTTQGILYLPKDHPVSLGSGAQPLKFTFKQCTYDPATNNVDTAGGTYLEWNSQGLQKIFATVGIGLPGSSVVPVDANDTRLTGQQDSAVARFSFTDWNDWMASLTFPNDFELSGLPGFHIHPGTAYYDHSTKVNPPNIQFPAGYLGATDPSFEGLFIPSLTMSMPKDFKSFGTTNGRASFGFNNFILDNTGVTTTISANNLLSIGNGSLGGWGFSIDQISIAVVENDFKEGMQMRGGIQLPLSQDSLIYTCNLNAGEGTGIQYVFAVAPSGSYNVKMWAATLSLDNNSAITIDNKTGSFVINAQLNGKVTITTPDPLPNVNITLLSFQNLGLTNNYQGSGNFHFDAGSWSLGGAPLKNLAYEPDRTGPHIGGSAELPEPAPGAGDGQDNADGFGINLNGFKPYFNFSTKSGVPTADMGITFTMNVNLDISGMGIDGGATMDIYGETQFPAGKGPQVNPIPKVNLDSVYLGGNFGPLTIKGGLAFYHGQGTYGDGVMGTLSAQFIGIGVDAAARFGNVSGYNYWGVAARVYSAAGIEFPPGLSINGLGGGFHYNMQMGAATDSASLNGSSSTPAGLINELQPKLGTLGFDAQVIMAFLQPNVVCMQPAFGMDFSGSAGLVDAWFRGNAEILSADPQDLAPGIVNAYASATFTPSPANFNCTIAVNENLFDIGSVNIPIQFNTGSGGDYLYIGTPASSDQDVVSGNLSSMVEFKMGFDAGIAHANVVAFAYFDVGDPVPSTPYIPPSISNVTDHNGKPMGQGALEAFSNMLSALNSSPAGSKKYDLGTGKAFNPGFLFGAGVHIDAGIDLVVVSADGSLDVGFATLLEHYNPGDVIASGCSADGKIGFNNWYALGIFYAGFSMDLGCMGITVGSLKAGAILSAGLVSPTWVSGDVYIEASALGVIHFEGNTSVNIGNPCAISRNPLDGLAIIGDLGPKEVNNAPVDVYELPYAICNVPLNQPYPVQVSGTETRTYQFVVQNFDVTGPGGQSLTKNVSWDYKVPYEVDFYHQDMLCGNASYTVHVRIGVQQQYSDGYGDPTGVDGKRAPVFQDTTFTFATGPRPNVIDPKNLMYAYPIEGQRYLLKNEFGSTGRISVGQNIDYLLNTGKVDDCGNPLDASSGATGVAGGGGVSSRFALRTAINPANVTKYVAKFISQGIHSDTLTTAFNYDPNTMILQFPFPAGLQNNASYQLQIWVIPPATAAHPASSVQASTQNKSVNVTTTVYTRDPVTGSLGKTTTTSAITNIGVTTQSLSGGRQLASKDSARCIFSTYFGTSQYSTFVTKMAAYGKWKTVVETPQYTIPIYSDAGAEPFDVFEIKGYSSTCTTGQYAPPVYPPLFQADVAWNAALENEKDAGNIYAGYAMLGNYTTIDLGEPEVRGSFDIPANNTVSLENMPYQPAISGGINLYSSYNMKAAAPTLALTHASGPSPASNRMVGSFMVQIPAMHYTLSGPTPAPPPPTPQGLLWKRDAYLMNDFDVIQAFAYDASSDQSFWNTQAVTDVVANCWGCTIVRTQVNYGSITITAGQYLSAMNATAFWQTINQVKAMRFPYYPHSAGRPLNFTYSYVFCNTCSIPPVQASSTFDYQTVSIIPSLHQKLIRP